MTAASRLKRFSRHFECLKATKSRNVNENVNDMNRREQKIGQIYVVEYIFLDDTGKRNI